MRSRRSLRQVSKTCCVCHRSCGAICSSAPRKQKGNRRSAAVDPDLVTLTTEEHELIGLTLDRWAQLGRRLLGWISRPRCPGCDQLVLRLHAWCDGCAQDIERAAPPHQHTQSPWATSGGAGQLYAGARYCGPVAHALRLFKYRARTDLAPSLADLACRALPAHAWSLVLPLPLHPRRLVQRGYNQSGLLASEIARRRRLPLNHDLLARVQATAPQAKLSRAERLGNVTDAFAAKPQVARSPHVLLVDDVVTTGATLAAAATALYRAGVQRVDAVAVAVADAHDRGGDAPPSN